ncbi:MAG: GTPase [Gammaproteobacteria bacterium]|nr:GTP-binding protein HSR1 [Gammaproteobacteria bacterium]
MTSDAKPRRRRWRWWREVTASVLLAVPLVVLIAAGLTWLWERGWLLGYLLTATTIALVVWAIARYRHRQRPIPAGADAPTITQPDPTWAPREQVAWETVRRMSAAADGSELGDRRMMLAAAQRTIEAVARHYHPARAAPALEFTLPELLLLTERLSRRLRLALLEHVPLSHRVKAGPVMKAWGYRPLIAAGFEHGRRLYQVLRVARTVSPVHAVIAELRDRVLGDLFDQLHGTARRRVVRLWIEEVGRAAIELYSGRTRVDAMELAAAAAREGLGEVAAPAAPPGSLRVLIAGQTNAGKSTLVNRLLGELGAGVDVLPLTAGFEGYELRHEGLPPAYLIDSPGIDDTDGVAEFVQRAYACDLIVWLAPAHRADRALDRAALDAVRAKFAADPARKMPPLIVVASHIDRLTPAREWSPPYNVDAPSSPKEHSIRGALDAIARDLLVPVETIVPMRLDTTPPYNLEILWLRLEALVEEAQRARWVRVLRDAMRDGGWRRSWRQLVGAGRMVRELVKPGDRQE